MLLHARRRSAVAGVFLALLALLFGVGAAPAPEPDPLNPPLPSLQAADAAPSGDTEGWQYTYQNLGKFWRIPPESSKLTTDNLDQLYTHDEYEYGTEEHLLTAWRDYLKKLKDSPVWEELSDVEKKKLWYEYLGQYVGVGQNRAKGAAFERLLDELFGYTALGYQHNRALPGAGGRRGDYFFVDDDGNLQVAIEAKSGKTVDRKQARMYAELAKKGARIIYILGADPDPATVRFLESLGFEVYYVRTMPQPGPADDVGTEPFTDTGPFRGPPGSFDAAGDLAISDDAVAGAVAASPSTAERAKALAEIFDEIARAEGAVDASDADLVTEDLGGVDFSTLELRYVSDDYDPGLGAGASYSYTVRPGDGGLSVGGQQAAQLAADSFFTWLALPPETFWVNLNPDEPDRIVDEKLGRTDAGRVLLEADLEMKRTAGKLIHPDTRNGTRFWRALRGENKCLSMRQWIVPKPAVVRDEGDELFILDAPLEVKMETEYLAATGVGGLDGCAEQSPEHDAHNEAVYQRMVLPKVERAVNHAPEYAELRRVYASRVAAEWFLERSITEPTAYDEIIGSGDVSRWPATKDWTPTDTFDEYVRSYRDGEFDIERTTREGNYLVTSVYVYGGVDFYDVPTEQVSDADFTKRYGGTAAAARDGVGAPSVEDGTDAVWLGGQVAERPPWNPYPEPPEPWSSPLFYVLTGLPVLAWLGLGAFLLRRRGLATAAPHREPAGASR